MAVKHGEVSWTVLTDPEGAELCLFDDGDAPSALVVDSADPVADARWWAEVLGGRLVAAPDGLRRWVDVPGMPFDVMKFVGVDEPKTVKNRVHWDVGSDARTRPRGSRCHRAARAGRRRPLARAGRSRRQRVLCHGAVGSGSHDRACARPVDGPRPAHRCHLRHRVGQRQRGCDRRRGRGSPARVAAPSGRARRQCSLRVHRRRPVRAGRRRGSPRHRAGGRQPAVPGGRWPHPRLRYDGHEERRRGRPAAGRLGARTRPGRHVGLLRLRRGRGGPQRVAPGVAATTPSGWSPTSRC